MKKKRKKPVIKIASIDDHIKRLCKNPKFKKEYLKEMKRLKIATKFFRKYPELLANLIDDVSNCCKAYIVVIGKCTHYYVCTKCGNGCSAIKE